MTGGGRPPRPTPPDVWLESLAVIDKNTPTPGMYIYTGVVVGSSGSYENSVFEIYYSENAPRLRLVHTGLGKITVFVISNDRFESLEIGNTSPVAAVQVLSAAGLNFEYGTAVNRPLDVITRESIVGRIDPTD